MKNPIILFFAMHAIIACRNNEHSIIVTGATVRIDTFAADCPYLTKDTKGNTILSWIRMINDTTTAFCYATSTDGKHFSSPLIIPNSSHIQPHGENMPKLIFKPSGEIIALWGAANPNPKNKYSGLVFYTRSSDNGKTWSEVMPLVNDTASYDQRYYDVAILPGGEAGITWLDNRKSVNKEGSGLYFASTTGGKGFENARLVSELCCQCCRTKLFVDKEGNIHALYRGILQDSIRDMVHIVSTDGGKGFSSPSRISEDNWVLRACPHTGPSMTESNAAMHFAWYTGGNNPGCYYTQTSNNGKSFDHHDSVCSKGTHPQILALDRHILIAWDEIEQGGTSVIRKIGVQLRDETGKALGKSYVTANENTSFPVMAATNSNSGIMAYTLQQGHHSFVTYRTFTIPN